MLMALACACCRLPGPRVSPLARLGREEAALAGRAAEDGCLSRPNSPLRLTFRTRFLSHADEEVAVQLNSPVLRESQAHI